MSILTQREWELSHVNEQLRKKMRRAVGAVVNRWRALNSINGKEAISAAADLRTAALVVAIERLARATLKRGIWP
jgi:glutamate dehydrogenase/leucine dehydrogenase